MQVKQAAMSDGVSSEVVDAALNGVTYDASVKARNTASLCLDITSRDSLRVMSRRT
jgi:hypothetical protein